MHKDSKKKDSKACVPFFLHTEAVPLLVPANVSIDRSWGGNMKSGGHAEVAASAYPPDVWFEKAVSCLFPTGI